MYAMFLITKIPLSCRKLTRVGDSRWELDIPERISKPIYGIEPKPTSHLRFPKNQYLVLIRLCQHCEILEGFGAPSRSQLITYLFYRYLVFMICCHSRWLHTTLQKEFRRRAILKEVRSFMPQPPRETGSLSISIQARWILQSFFVPSHRKLETKELILWTKPIGILKLFIQ